MLKRAQISTTRVPVIILLLSIMSCSLDYDDAIIADNLSETLPDTVLYEFTHVAVENGRPTFRMSAEVAETYAQRNETILTDVSFLEYDENGEIASEGSAARAIYATDSDDAELSGGIYVYSRSQEAQIRAETLSWNDAARTLTGAEGETVAISEDSGSELAGSGFSADMATLEFRFSGVVSGTWADDEDE